MKKTFAVIASISTLLGTSAFAADMPVKAPVYKAPPAVAASGNWYFWLDGMYENVRLPTYSLGLHNDAGFAAGDRDLGTVQTFTPRLDGGGVRGALGYMIPGTGARVEVGGSYIAARGTTSQNTTPTLPTNFVSVQLLNGAGAGGFSCFGAFTCNTAGSLSTSYSSWQINGKIADDFKYGTITVTPSGALFGGNSRDSQSLTQAFTQIIGGAVVATGTYAASTALHWNDFGGRVGLDVSAAVTNALTFGIGGWIGGAARNVSMAGTDIAASAPFTFFNGASAISTSANTGVFLANGEAGFAYQWSPTVTLRGFGGVNFDNRVPGITNPTFAGSVIAPTSTTPAGIYFAHETSYYAGGGFLVRF